VKDQAIEERIVVERAFGELKVCIFNSVTSQMSKGEMSDTAMQVATATACAVPYRKYLSISICKDPRSSGCDDSEHANAVLAFLVKSVKDDMLRSMMR
jgi:hypothetical protein